MNFNFTLFELIKEGVEFQKRKEKYVTDNGGTGTNGDKAAGMILGMSVGVYAVALIIALVIWITAIVLLVSNWKNLPTWARVVGVLGLLPIIPMGPIISLIVVIIAKNQSHSVISAPQVGSAFSHPYHNMVQGYN